MMAMHKIRSGAHPLREPLSISWSSDRSGMRTDAYGGRCLLVTQTQIETMDTSMWLADYGIHPE
jgi:hypothetical protein